MKKLIVFGLLFSFLSPITELHELLKLPHLILHFTEHSTDFSGESFADFLQEHYAHEHDGTQDEHHDNGCLPFQGHGCKAFNPANQFFEMHANLRIAFDLQISQEHYPLVESFTSNYSAPIWQPPKLS